MKKEKEQILKRLKELDKEVREATDIEFIQKAKEERGQLLRQLTELEEIEERQGALEEMAKNNDLGNVIESRGAIQIITEDSKEYRNAYLKSLMGKDLTEIEQRALTSSNIEAVMPTMTATKIITALKGDFPIMNAFNFSTIPANLDIPIWETDNEAEVTKEGVTLKDRGDSLATLSLGGYIIEKYITLTNKASVASVDAFEDYLVQNLVKNVGKKIAAIIVNGTGTNQGTGLAKAGNGSSGAYTETDSVTVANNKEITTKDITKWLGMVNFANAKITMSYSTFLEYFYEFMDNAKNNLVREINGTYHIIGHLVYFEDSVEKGVAYLFNSDGFAGNFQQPIMVEKGRVLSSLKNEYVAHCLFDCKPATKLGFFAKFTKAQS